MKDSSMCEVERVGYLKELLRIGAENVGRVVVIIYNSSVALKGTSDFCMQVR